MQESEVSESELESVFVGFFDRGREKDCDEGVVSSVVFELISYIKQIFIFIFNKMKFLVKFF